MKGENHLKDAVYSIHTHIFVATGRQTSIIFGGHGPKIKKNWGVTGKD